MNFTQQLWESVSPLYSAIISHPFNEELAAGTLEGRRFRYYIQQDALYLLDFARALSVIAGRAEQTEHVLRYIRFAEGAIVVERALHGQYFQQFGISDAGLEKSPACFSYTNYLLATCFGQPYQVGMAAVLPCFWIYREVGNYIHRHHQPNNPYQAWIDTYAGEAFAAVVEDAIRITEEVARESSQGVKKQMQEAFVYSSRLEWLFWDSAYRLESFRDIPF
jgi:thiaminase/transcriptional activator TenA